MLESDGQEIRDYVNVIDIAQSSVDILKDKYKSTCYDHYEIKLEKFVVLEMIKENLIMKLKLLTIIKP